MTVYLTIQLPKGSLPRTKPWGHYEKAFQGQQMSPEFTFNFQFYFIPFQLHLSIHPDSLTCLTMVSTPILRKQAQVPYLGFVLSGCQSRQGFTEQSRWSTMPNRLEPKSCVLNSGQKILKATNSIFSTMNNRDTKPECDYKVSSCYNSFRRTYRHFGTSSILPDLKHSISSQFVKQKLH